MGVGVVGLIMSQSYSDRARLIPMWLSVFVIIIMLLLFLQENVPAVGKYLSFMDQSGLFAKQKIKTDSAEQSEKDKQEYRILFRLLIWLAAFTTKGLRSIMSDMVKKIIP